MVQITSQQPNQKAFCNKFKDNEKLVKFENNVEFIYYNGIIVIMGKNQNKCLAIIRCYTSDITIDFLDEKNLTVKDSFIENVIQAVGFAAQI